MTYYQASKTFQQPRVIRPVIGRLILGVFFILPGSRSWATEGLPFLTGFESTEVSAYVTGDLSGQGTSNSWSVTSGSVNVSTGAASRGVQAVEMSSSSVVEVAVLASNHIVWTDVYLQSSGSTNTPLVPSGKATCVLFCNSSSGLWALDGNGDGGGIFVSVANPFSTGQYVRVSVRKNYTTAEYDLWIDGLVITNGLGFKDNDLSSLKSIELISETTSSFDDLSVTLEGIDADTDMDGLLDLDETKFHGTSFTDADSDGDGMSDGDEVMAGTSATNSASLLKVSAALVGNQVDVSVETVTGRFYTIRSTSNIISGTWQDVPGFINVPGDSTVKSILVDIGNGLQFFRALVTQ